MAIKARMKPKFPARVLGGDGVSVTKENGVYTIAVEDSEPTDLETFPFGVLVTGNNTAVAPTLGSSYLEICNTSAAAQYIGGELRFSTTTGDPYALIKSELISGPAPYFGDLTFWTRESETDPLVKRLALKSHGTLYSGELSDEVEGPVNYAAVNEGAQNFLGYSSNEITDGAAFSGYFVADNNIIPGGEDAGSTGIYAEGRVWNDGAGIGAEIDAQNLSGTDARDIDPNSMFGTGDAPWAVAMWTQSSGSHPGTSYDISAALGIIAAIHTGDPLFRKGIVIDKNAIQTVSSHKEAIALGTGHEIVWYDGSNSAVVNRLSSDGTNMSAATTALTVTGAVGAGSRFIGTAANAAGAQREIVVRKTGIADNTATSIITVTVPNSEHNAAIFLDILAHLGTGTDLSESSRCATGAIVLARKTGVDTVATAATLTTTQIATTSGGGTLTLAYGVSSITGASSATQTVDIQVTLVKTGTITDLTAVVSARLLNSLATGVTMAASA